jgi:hypothetical protein
MPLYLQTHVTSSYTQHTTHNTTQQKMVKIVLVGFLPNDHGCSCGAHPFGCGNALLESEGKSVGRLLHLRLVEQIHLAGYAVQEDGIDDRHVCFAA